MRNAGYVKDSESAFRSNYARYRSPAHRLRFLDALRKELTVYIDQHRTTCKYPNDPTCIHERAYATTIEMVRDELEMTNPAIAARHESQSFSQIEANQINALLNTLVDKMTSMESELGVLTTSTQFTYDDIIELLEEMRDKLPYGKRDWLDLLKTRLFNVGLDETINQSIVSPTLKHISEVIASSMSNSNL